MGIKFELELADMAARINFATVDRKGKVEDRRAGRVDTDTNRRLCKKIRENISQHFDGQFFIESVSEHRGLLVLRGLNLMGNLWDTDPQRTGVFPIEPEALTEGSEMTARVVRSFLHQTKEVVSDEKKANMVLLRGIYIAEYPMYRGISRLLGMEVAPPPGSMKTSFENLMTLYGNDYDLYFLHIKKTDSSGEDSDFDEKAKIIEKVDRLLPMVANLELDVLVVPADHSTPALMGTHIWHPVPITIRTKLARVDLVDSFDEYARSFGSLGMSAGVHLMGLALAHTGRLKKYGG